MKKNRIIATAGVLALVIALLCGVLAVTASEVSVNVDFVSMADGIADVNMTLAVTNKTVDYAQITLRTPTQGVAFLPEASTSIGGSFRLEGRCDADGAMTVLAERADAGFAGVAGGEVLFPVQLSGTTNNQKVAVEVDYILCYTDGTEAVGSTQSEITVTGTLTSRLEAETDAVLWRYTDTTEPGISGSSAGDVVHGTIANLQSFQELADGAWLKKSEHPMLSFLVDVEESGTYTWNITHNGAMSVGNLSDYFMVLSVDDSDYVKSSYVGTHPSNENYHITQAKLNLSAGRHVVRVLTALADTRCDTRKVNWLNVDGVDAVGPGAVTAVAPQQTHLLSGEAPYINNYQKSTELDDAGYAYWVSSLGSYRGDTATANAGITCENFIIDNLSYLGYFSYTVEVPVDGYYDLQTYLRTNTNTNGTGNVLMLIDGEKHIVPVVAGYATYPYNVQNLSCYLTEGVHNIVVSGIMEYTAASASKNWCDLGALTVTGGITTQGVEQIDPASFITEKETVYLSASGSDVAAGTQDAPVASLATALTRVANGGTIVLADNFVAGENFTWPASDKAVTITGGAMDFTALTQVDIHSAVTFDATTLKIANDAQVYANGNTVKICENVTVSGVGRIYGGSANTSVASTDLTVLAGTYSAIYGGGDVANVTGEAKLVVGGNVNADVDVTNHDLSNNIYGGSRRGNVGVTNVTVQDNAKAVKVLGGGSGTLSADWCDFGTANVTVNGGSFMGIYGGNIFGPGKAGCEINITVNGGTTEQIFGGHEWAHTNLNGNVNIILNGGTITRRVYGGCYNNCSAMGVFDTDRHVVGNITLTITADVNITFAKSVDRSIYAHSRHKNPADEEISTIVFADHAAYEKYGSKLGAQDSTMKSIMGSLAAADHIQIPSGQPDGLVETETGYRLEKDVTTVELAVESGKTLDLNGYTLHVTNLACFGDVVDTSEGNTGAVVAENLSLSNNSYLPIYDSANGCYKFYAYELNSLGTRENADGTVTFGFAIDFANADAYALLAQGGSCVDVTMTLSWADGSKAFALDSALIQRYAKLQANYPALRLAMMLTVTGVDTLGSGATLTVTPAVQAAGEVSMTGSEMTYTVA